MATDSACVILRRKTNLLSMPPTTMNDFIKFLEDQLDVFLHSKSTYKTMFIEQKPRTRATITDIVSHLVEFLPCTSECLIIGLIYLHRIEDRNKGYVNSETVAFLYATAVMVASKFYDDECCDNWSFASCLMIQTSKLMAMEIELLNSLKFSCHFSQEQFDLYFSKLQSNWKKKEYSLSPRRHAQYFPISPSSLTNDAMEEL